MLGKVFREFVALLNAHHVEYLVVGAYAVGVHGHPRYTGDLDVWVRPTITNAQQVVAAINEFGFEAFNLKADDFSRPGRILQMGREPSRIDVMTAIDGVDFEQAWSGRISIELDGLSVNFIGFEDLKTNKLATGRPKDRLDHAELTGNA